MQRYLLIFMACLSGLLTTHAQRSTIKKMKKEIATLFAQQPGVYALAFNNLQTGQTLYINEREIFHAASTMKTAVLVEAYKQTAAGHFKLSDSITVTNYFQSIADSSNFSISAADDSQTELYHHIGEKISLYELLYQMIIYSSNLATNIVIEKLGAANITATLRSMGAHSMQVLRGVEDSRAFEKGMNNVVSAYDLALLFNKMAGGTIVSKQACDDMIKILLDQRFNEIIPGKLPAEVKVAHKTGSITGVQHDSGIVFLPDGRKYVLVLLSKNLPDEKSAIDAMATVSAKIYQYMISH
jgi:beta-lactamase class A